MLMKEVADTDKTSFMVHDHDYKKKKKTLLNSDEHFPGRRVSLYITEM